MEGARLEVRPGQAKRDPARQIAAGMIARGVEVLYVQVAAPEVAGFGIGLRAHESPMLRPGVGTVLEAGMVLAVEVPCYHVGQGGFAPEDNLVVTRDGVRLLTNAELELPVVA